MANDLESLHLPRLDLGVFKSSCRYLERIGKPTIPFQPPKWTLPASRKPLFVALIDVFKLNEVIASVNVDTKSFFVFGRNALVCDIVLEHCSISRMHACLVHHVDGSVYIIDLGSCHGTFIDTEKLEPLRPTLITHGAQLRYDLYQLQGRDMTIRFGVSSRTYRFKSYESKEQILTRLRNTVGLHDEERILQTNTLLNRFLSYRLDLPAPTHQATMCRRASTTTRVASNSTETNEDPSQMDDDPASSASSTSSHSVRHSSEGLDSFAMVDITEDSSQQPKPHASRKRTRPASATDRTNQVFLTFDIKRVRFVPDPPTIIPNPYDEDGNLLVHEHDDVAMECDYDTNVFPMLNYGPMGDTPMDECLMENPFATVAPDSGRCAMPISFQFPLCSDRPSLEIGGRRRSSLS